MSKFCKVVGKLERKYYIKLNSDDIEIWKTGHDLMYCVCMSKSRFKIYSDYWDLMGYHKGKFDNEMLDFIVEMQVHEIEESLGRKLIRHWEK